MTKNVLSEEIKKSKNNNNNKEKRGLNEFGFNNYYQNYVPPFTFNLQPTAATGYVNQIASAPYQWNQNVASDYLVNRIQWQNPYYFENKVINNYIIYLI